MAHYLTPEHIFTGRDCLSEAVGYLKKCGKKALLVTGPYVVKSEIFADCGIRGRNLHQQFQCDTGAWTEPPNRSTVSCGAWYFQCHGAEGMLFLRIRRDV